MTRLIVDHLRHLAPERWDPLREALRFVGRSPSVCSLLGVGADSGAGAAAADDDDDGYCPAMVGQADVRLVLAGGNGDGGGDEGRGEASVDAHVRTNL